MSKIIKFLRDKVCRFLYFKQAGYVMNVNKHHSTSSKQPDKEIYVLQWP